jgi:hypothetical protein
MRTLPYSVLIVALALSCADSGTSGECEAAECDPETGRDRRGRPADAGDASDDPDAHIDTDGEDTAADPDAVMAEVGDLPPEDVATGDSREADESDVALDPPSDPDADVIADVTTDVDREPAGDPARDADTIDAGPPTPPRGTYRYRALEIGATGCDSHDLDSSVAVEFHPSGDYAIVLEQFDFVHVVNWEDSAERCFDLKPASGNIYWEDLAFEADGAIATLVGRHRWTVGSDSFEEGVIASFSDGSWRSYFDDGADVEVFRRVELDSYPPFVAITHSWLGGNPVILQRNGSSGSWSVTLRQYDPVERVFSGLVTTESSAVGCDDIAYVDNEWGNPGIVVVCGTNGADTLYYTRVADTWVWRHDRELGNTNLGNSVHVASHPSGQYALIVSWSGRAIYRIEGGLLNGYSDAPRFSTRGIWGIGFQQNGARALIVGRASGDPRTGSVIEYRHDEYDCSGAGDCGLTDVSIPNFAAGRFLGTSNTYLFDVDFRPHCDGGLIVGGDNALGLIIEFKIEGEGTRPCR